MNTNKTKGEASQKLPHKHSFTRSKPSASVETCGCGKFRFTEHAGPSIEEVTENAVDSELTRLQENERRIQEEEASQELPEQTKADWEDSKPIEPFNDTFRRAMAKPAQEASQKLPLLQRAENAEYEAQAWLGNMVLELASQRDEYKRQAEKLAEALRGMMQAFAWNSDATPENELQSDVKRARQALAAWEERQ